MPSQHKVFPLRLPPHYHGTPKPFRKLTELNQQRSVDRQNPEFTQTKIGNWQIKRLDRDVVRERREYLVHPAKISQDTPEWFKTTFHHFHRANHQPTPTQRREDRHFDVLNRKRVDPFAQTGPFEERQSRFRSNASQVTGKVGEVESMGLSRYSGMKGEVAGKIGSIEYRDYSVRKPIIKIGQTHAHNFVNTYSIA